jgi:hypothetical protein
MSSEKKEHSIVGASVHELKASLLHPGEPLWKRAPTRGADGKPLHDFMMLIPGLRQREEAFLRDVVAKIEMILKRYEEYVVLADLNLKMNVLWVTVKPNLGICMEIASMIHHTVPEAKLVAQHHER